MKYLGRIVVVEHLEDKISSVIELPETATLPATRAVKATVVGVGSKSRWLPHLSVGDTVIVHQHLGSRITVNDNPVIIYDDDDVLAIVS